MPETPPPAVPPPTSPPPAAPPPSTPPPLPPPPSLPLPLLPPLLHPPPWHPSRPLALPRCRSRPRWHRRSPCRRQHRNPKRRAAAAAPPPPRGYPLASKTGATFEIPPRRTSSWAAAASPITTPATGGTAKRS